MKKGYLLLPALLLLPLTAQAGEFRQIHAEWDHADEPDIAGYRLYYNNNVACESYDSQARQLDCEVFIESYPASFTATAYDSAGQESARSDPFVLEPPLNEPPEPVLQVTDGQGNTATAQPAAEIIIDNNDAGATASGTWKASGGLDPYGDGSLYSDQAGAAYAFEAQTSGATDVFLWWTEYNNRETAAQVEIYDGNTLLDTVTVNQQANGGQWNLLGNYTFSDTARIVVVSSADGSTTVCADAVRLISAETIEGTAPLTMSFDGSGSVDPDGSITRLNWDFGDGQTGSGQVVSHTFAAPGTYPVVLTVTDDQNTAAQTKVSVVVTEAQAPAANEPPLASIFADLLEGQAPLAVNFDGVDSMDPDGTIALYNWDFGDGQTAQGQTATHIYTAAGTYTVTLVVTDDSGATAKTQAMVTVAENTSTAAGFAFNFQPDNVEVPEGYVVDSGTAYNDITGFGWTQSPGPLGTRDRNSSYSPDQTYDTLIHVTPTAVWELALPNGNYLVTVCAGDPASPDSIQGVQAEGVPVLNSESLSSANRWLEHQVPVSVQDGRLTMTFEGSSPHAKLDWLKVEHANSAPTAVAAASTLSGPAPLAVSFSGSQSSDPDGTIAGYSWDFGDGATSTGPTVDHTYQEAGTYTATLTVRDDKGATHTARTTIKVEAGNQGGNQEIIVDNSDAGATSSGTWKKSGGASPYGSGSVYTNEPGASYAYKAAVNGTTEVAMWWTEFNNRDTAAKVEIYDGTTLLDTVTVNQQANGGQWNTLGTYSFGGQARVVIVSGNNTSTTTCADAVKFVAAANDGGSTTPTTPEPPATSNPEPTQPVEMIVDNSSAASTGTWKTSGGANPYGSGSVFTNEPGATYTFEGAASGNTEVAMWWTEFSNRETAVQVEIYDGATLLDTVTVNQQANGGQWNTLGTYSFSGQARVVIVAGSNTNTTTCADAVKFTSSSDGATTPTTPEPPATSNPEPPAQPVEMIVDNSSAASTGTWKKSGGANPYGNGSVYTNEPGATYTFEGTASGNTEIAMWWTEFSNRETAAQVEIYDGNTLIDTVTVNQRANGGQWNTLGTYSFSGQARVKIIAGNNTSTTTCADAVKFTTSSDSTTAPEPPATTNPEPPAQPVDMIVDNGAAGAASTGIWKTSGGADPYGNGSVYTNEPGATYTFEGAVSGNTEVSMWWTEYSNRETAVQVEIYDGNTLIDTVTVNQKANGGQWNALGTYSFSGRAKVVIVAGNDKNTTTCADAVRFVQN